MPVVARPPKRGSPGWSQDDLSFRVRSRRRERSWLSRPTPPLPVGTVTLPFLNVDGRAVPTTASMVRALREQIGHNLEVYFDRFRREVHLEPDEARARATPYFEILADHPYLDGVRGLADGSGLPLVDLLVLNVRYELLLLPVRRRRRG